MYGSRAFFLRQGRSRMSISRPGGVAPAANCMFCETEIAREIGPRYWPPQLVGFLIAAAGMVAGSLLTPRHETNFPPGRESLSA